MLAFLDLSENAKNNMKKWGVEELDLGRNLMVKK